MGHGNTPICTGKTRTSIVQDTSGGLFRRVAYGLRSAKLLPQTHAGKLLKNQIAKAVGEHWKQGLAMFPMLDGLEGDVKEVFDTIE